MIADPLEDYDSSMLTSCCGVAWCMRGELSTPHNTAQHIQQPSELHRSSHNGDNYRRVQYEYGRTNRIMAATATEEHQLTSVSRTKLIEQT